MSETRFERSVLVPGTARQLFEWHARPGAFDRLNPPWEPAQIVASGDMRDGERVVLKVGPGPFPLTWIARYRDVDPASGFTDEQEKGPFAAWTHRHAMEDGAPGEAHLHDRIQYRLPLGAVGRLFGGRVVAKKLDRMFAWRHRITAADLRERELLAPKPLRWMVTGASGLVGSVLVPFLRTMGHVVHEGVRRDPKPGSQEIRWDAERGVHDPEAAEGLDVVVHLAGENVAGGRWTDARKGRIEDSRVGGTRQLAESLARLKRPPAAWVGASAVGFYGDRPGEVVDEESEVGEGWLCEVCQRWEQASESLAHVGTRRVHLRIGIVLDPRGGALGRMLTPFRMGLGGRLGSGKQGMSWITSEDLARMFHIAGLSESWTGPINAAAPTPTDNAGFTTALGKALGRWTVVPAPAFALKLAFGHMAERVLLRGAKAVPTRAKELGFTWRQPELVAALKTVLGRT